MSGTVMLSVMYAVVMYIWMSVSLTCQSHQHQPIPVLSELMYAKEGRRFTNQARLKSYQGEKLKNLINHTVSEACWKHFTLLSHSALQRSQAVHCEVIWPLYKWLHPLKTNRDTHIDTHARALTHLQTHVTHTMQQQHAQLLELWCGFGASNDTQINHTHNHS